MYRPPYFDWRLDRWKIGLSLALWLGLILFAPGQSTPIDPQGASPIARLGQLPVSGGSTQTQSPSKQTEANLPPAIAGQADEIVENDVQHENPAGDKPATPAPFSVGIWEQGTGPLGNSTPLFYGTTTVDGLVEIHVAGQQYSVVADSTGYWQFAPTTPLPLGMTWVQVRRTTNDGTALSDSISMMALIDTSARPISAPTIQTPVPASLSQQDSTPLLSGIGPPGLGLIFYRQNSADGEIRPFAETTVTGDGQWRWQLPSPLEVGTVTLWAVAVDETGIGVSRSWPINLVTSGDGVSSANAESPGSNSDAIR